MPRLSFADYQIINDNIVEFTADKDAKLDIAEAHECLELYTQLNRTLGILVNRTHPYTSSLEFVMSIAEFQNIAAFAVWVPNERTAITVDTQKMFFPVPFKHFFDHDEALSWLKQHLS